MPTGGRRVGPQYFNGIELVKQVEDFLTYGIVLNAQRGLAGIVFVRGSSLQNINHCQWSAAIRGSCSKCSRQTWNRSSPNRRERTFSRRMPRNSSSAVP
jgi:hypothetical protein